MSDTLVLSTSFQPIATISWRKAFGLLFSGKVEVVKYHQDRVVRTVSENFNVPSVVRFVKDVFLNNKKKTSLPAKYNRTNVYIRDKGACQYCNKKLSRNSYTLDHVKPISQGGKSNWLNIVLCCHACNKYKNDMTPEQAGMRLANKPYVPTDIEIQSHSQNNDILKNIWNDYLNDLLNET